MLRVFAAVSRPLLAACFALCDLRLFVIERIFSLRASLRAFGASSRVVRLRLLERTRL